MSSAEVSGGKWTPATIVSTVTTSSVPSGTRTSAASSPIPSATSSHRGPASAKKRLISSNSPRDIAVRPCSVRARAALVRTQLCRGTIENGIHVLVPIRRTKFLREADSFADHDTKRHIIAHLELVEADQQDRMLDWIEILERPIEQRGEIGIEYLTRAAHLLHQFPEVFAVGARHVLVRQELLVQLLPRLSVELGLVNRLHRQPPRYRARAYLSGAGHRTPSAFQAPQQVRHFDGSDRSFGPLVAILAAGALHCLLDAIGRQHTKRDRDAGFKRNPREAAGAFTGHVLEVWRRPPDHGTERNHRIVAARREELLDRQGHFERTRDTDQFDLLFGGAVAPEGLNRSADQALDNEFIEARGDDREAQVARQVIAFHGANGVHECPLRRARQYNGCACRSPQVSLSTYSVISRSNAEMAAIWRGALKTRIRVTPRSCRICAPMPYVRSTGAPSCRGLPALVASSARAASTRSRGLSGWRRITTTPVPSSAIRRSASRSGQPRSL